MSGVAFLMAVPVRAQQASHTSDTAQPAACTAQLAAEAGSRALDADLVKTVDAELAKGGYAALAPRLPVLIVVTSHAPTTARKVECDGSTTVYVDSSAAALAALMPSATQKGGVQTITRAVNVLPYAQAYLFLGEWNVEQHDYAKAVELLRRGLVLAPTEPHLTSEIANALNQIGGQTEAISICDNTLAQAFDLQPADRARVLRAKGYALGDLGRFDEAIAVYRQSLTYSPNHPGAMNEIAYLTKRKGGGAATAGGLFTAKQAADASTFGKVAPPADPAPKP